MIRPTLLLAIAAVLLALAPATSRAQVLIYKVAFSAPKGINFHTFEGGYVVAPLLGGAASFLLTSSEDGRTFVESPSGGSLFTAVSGSGNQKAVLSAPTGGGTALGAIVALGDVNHVLKVSNRTVSLTARVAQSLNGTLVSADDESTAETTATDGSLGSAGTADVKFSLDEDATSRANKDGLTVDATIEQLKLELKRQGYSQSGNSSDEEAASPQTPSS